MTENGKQHLGDFLSTNNILCGVRASTPEEILTLLLETVKRHVPTLDLELAKREVQAREALFPTVIAPGLAVPHARLPGLNEPIVAMACSQDGVSSPGSRFGDVKVTILLLTPLDEPNLHLQLFAALSSDFSREGMVDRIGGLATPLEVLNELSGRNAAEIPDYLTAGDVMTAPPETLLETDTLNKAIRAFATQECEELVVLDNSGDLRGTLALSQLLKKSLPEHLLWMENLAPIYRFQPFSEMLKSADETKIADVMNEEFISVESDVPAIQLAKLFLVHRLRQLIITKKGKFAGVVELRAFCARLFWE